MTCLYCEVSIVDLSLIGTMSFDYELDVDPFYMNLLCKLHYEYKGYNQVTMVKEIVLVKE